MSDTAEIPAPPSVELIVQIGRLRDADRHVRAEAAHALGRSGDAQAVGPLIVALQDAEAPVRFNAAWALWQLADARSFEALCAALWDPVSEVRSAATFALGRLGDVRAVEPLCQIVRWYDRSVRYAAATALWEIGNATVLPQRILAATTLTPAQKLQALEALNGVIYVIEGQEARTQRIAYTFGGAWPLCTNLCRQTEIEAAVREGAEAVMAELRNREAARMLLRATERQEPREPLELLRSVSEESTPTPPEELLRPGGLPSRPVRVGRQGFLDRIFKRR